MFAKTKKKTLLEQASDFATDVTEALAPHVENAKAQAGPVISDAKAAAAPKLADARAAADSKLEGAKDSLLNDVVPVIAAAIASAKADAVEKAAPIAEEAKARGFNAAQALKGEEPQKKGGKGKKILLLAALVGVGVAVAKRLQANTNQATAWQSNYKPTPNTPAPGGAHAAPVAPVDPVSPSAPQSGTEDAAAATPGEALSDSTETPHPVSDPDAPVDSVDVSDLPDPGAKN